MAAKFGIFADEEHDSFPPKLHERPYKLRFIVTSSSCTTTELKKSFFHVCKATTGTDKSVF